MTAVVVAVLDRDEFGANTDVIVIADDRRRRLTWVPRDLWSPLIGDRINKAFARGGGELLLRCLEERAFPCEGVLTFRRSATEDALADAVVTVPVRKRLDFWYPTEPTRPIEEGRKAITFVPPRETLAGERIHQWIGARTTVRRSGSDLDRCDRQHVFLRALLSQRADFSRVLDDPRRWRSTGVDPLPVLAKISVDWEMRTFRSVRGAMIDGKAVLLPAGLLRRASARVAHAMRRPWQSRRLGPP